MIIAIDDTYGPTTPTKSRFVTGARRTHVGVVFSDVEAAEVREQLSATLGWVRTLLPTAPREFHFVDIYNGTGPWQPFRESRRNLSLIAGFCSIYSNNRWPVVVQTVDDRTIKDARKLIAVLPTKADGLDFRKREDLSLLLLCAKLKVKFKPHCESLTLIVDEGRHKKGAAFGSALFSDWPAQYAGYYASSADEPLLQIADLLAFCINRSTYLAAKQNRTQVDQEFLAMVGEMRIRSDDLAPIVLPPHFTVADLDRFHELDREYKRLR